MTSSPDKKNTLYVTTRKAWHQWLQKHYQSEKEVWLVFFKKHTGKPRISYNDSVEEALCFGWIDSTVKTIDHERFAQRSSPRNPRSPYSQSNRERLRDLMRQGKVAKEVREIVGDLAGEEFTVPPDILKAIKASKDSWKNFKGLSPSYIRIRIAFIDGARRRFREFQKRLDYFIRMTERNKLFGYGDIEMYC
jgi:uncharacterized protein YdeI (YjbR/CyaY-like superfamily)